MSPTPKFHTTMIQNLFHCVWKGSRDQHIKNKGDENLCVFYKSLLSKSGKFVRETHCLLSCCVFKPSCMRQLAHLPYFLMRRSCFNYLLHFIFIYNPEHQRNLNQFFKATLTKIHYIKINHIWTMMSYSTPCEAHLQNERVAFVKRRKILWNWRKKRGKKEGGKRREKKNRKEKKKSRKKEGKKEGKKKNIFKNYRNCSLRTSKKGHLFRTFKSYSFNFNGGLCNRRIGFCLCQILCSEGKQFCDFFKNYLMRFHFTPANKCFEMCLVRSSIPYFVPNYESF